MNALFIALSFIDSFLAEASIDRLLQLIDVGGFQSKSIVRKVYYNIGVYYFSVGYPKRSQEYFEKATSIITIKRHPTEKISELECDIYGHNISGKPFSPIFMAHWNMEFNNFSELSLTTS